MTKTLVSYCINQVIKGLSDQYRQIIVTELKSEGKGESFPVKHQPHLHCTTCQVFIFLFFKKFIISQK